MITRIRIRRQSNRNTALLSQERGVDVGDRIVDERLEDALERREFEHTYVVLRGSTQNLDIDARQRRSRH